MTAPTQAGFLNWIRTVMQIAPIDLPDNSISITYAYDVSLDICDPSYACVSPLGYMLMVYNLGGDNLINYAPNNPPSTYFTDARKTFKINSFTPGVVTSASDQGTSASLLNPDFMKNLTMANLNNLKTPWGITYMGWAQRSGTIWGLT